MIRKVKHVGAVELPPEQQPKPRKSKYQFDKLEIGQRIEVRYSRENQSTILTAARLWAKRKNNGATFGTNKVGNKLYLTRKT